jgi:hypothetical protein
MKITRSNYDALNDAQRKKLANVGCDVCPCCGETKNFLEYFKEGILNKGLSEALTCRNYAEGSFKFRYMQVDCYSCYTCGARWESEPYEI